MSEETRSTRGRIESFRRPSYVAACNNWEEKQKKNKNNQQSSSESFAVPSSSAVPTILFPSFANQIATDRRTSTTSLDTLNGTNYLRDFIKLLKELNEKLSRKIIDRSTLIEVCSLLKIYGSSIDTSPTVPTIKVTSPDDTSVKQKESEERKQKREEQEDEDESKETPSTSESKEQLNYFFKQLKQLIKDNQLDTVTKGHVLHVIELRRNNWLTVNGNNNVLISKSLSPIAFAETRKDDLNENKMSSKEAISDKVINYDHVHPRDYVTEDFLIRNSDTNKVMGFKGVRTKIIEEISKTCITFPKAKKRDLVRRIQITGPDASCIQRAKELIGEAIRRNSTPFEDVGGTALAAVTTIFCSALFKTSYVAWGNLLDDD